jgi:adenylyl-sulfate kinase
VNQILSDKGITIWLTGLPGAGKSTASQMLAERLRALGATVEVLDGDVVRTHFSKGLGFSKADREENVRRIGLRCGALASIGTIAIAAAVSPYRATREEVRSQLANFVEVYVECPLNVLVERDPKGLYRRALAGEIDHFTGISDPYEPPLAPEVTIHTAQETPEESVGKILQALHRLKLLRQVIVTA